MFTNFGLRRCFVRREACACLLDDLLDIGSADAITLHDQMNQRVRKHIFQAGLDVGLLSGASGVIRLFHVCLPIMAEPTAL